MEKELLLKIIKKLQENECSFEDNGAKIEGISYGICEFREDAWIDEGKYQYTNETGRLCSFDENWNVIEKFDIYLDQPISRSGSYYSDWYYMYQPIEPFTIETVMIPEKIIPAHEELKRVYMSK